MEEDLSLVELFKVLKRRFAIILIIFIAATALGGGISVLLNEQEYASTTSLLVGREKEVLVEEAEDEEAEPVYETTIEYGDATISKQAASFYDEIINSKDVLEEVIDSLNLDISVGNLRKNISMDIPSESSVIKITFKNKTVANANTVVDEVTKVFMNTVFEMTEIENIKVMNYANEPVVTNTQNTKLNTAVSMVLGLMLGVLVAFIMEYMDDRIRTADNVEKKLDLEVIGQLTDQSHIREDLKAIRTNIQFSNRFKGKKALVITSPQENRAIVNLGSDLSNIIAENDKKVLIIDANLRNPGIHKHFNISNDRGLSNILQEDIDIGEGLNIYSENKNLHILTTGNMLENPTEQLSGDRIKELLSNLYDKYDYMILNSYPIDEVTDSVALSAVADGVILALKSNESKEKDIENAKRALNKVNANIIGVILSQEK